MPRVTKAQVRQDELTRAKLEMVAARERGEDALRPLLAQHPTLAGDLIDFSAALAATSAYSDIELTPETETIAMQARESAFAAVFEAATPAVAKAPAFASLKALRQARKISMPAVAAKLGLGVDVVSALEAGRVRAASAPERLLRSLGEMLDTTADQIMALLGAQPAISPALRRARGDVSDAEPLDFAEAVRLSPEMSEEAKANWLKA
ncbi:MAG TPA: helix-turn-helix transcriptional regulator [Ktedonobacterales bacterium]|jgi:transcriptional regulator with XRE-family HTH domain